MGVPGTVLGVVRTAPGAIQAFKLDGQEDLSWDDVLSLSAYTPSTSIGSDRTYHFEMGFPPKSGDGVVSGPKHSPRSGGNCAWDPAVLQCLAQCEAVLISVHETEPKADPGGWVVIPGPFLGVVRNWACDHPGGRKIVP